MSEKRDNSGAIFRNERKEKNTHPDHTGQATIDGREYWISAWVKESGGKRFFSLAFKPKEEKPTRPALQPKKPLREEMDDEIPF